MSLDNGPISGAPIPTVRTNAPIYAFLTLVTFVAGIVVLTVTDNEDDGGLFIALAISTLPSLVASMFAERAARDIRNGVLEAKVKRGATAAIAETGVMLRNGPVAAAQLEALTTILSEIHGTAQNTNATVNEIKDKQNDR